MKLLVLVQDYPSEHNKYAMNFVHTRNLEYVKNGVDVTVLSFSATGSYSYDSIKVISSSEYEATYSKGKFDLVLSHAPNVRNHIRFLNKHDAHFKRILFFIHGHEVMRMADYYPEPYDYMKKGKKHLIQNIYDSFKLYVINKYISKRIQQKKLSLVFVSKWMRDVFQENSKLNPETINANSYIISNSMNSVFLERLYKQEQEIKADFITIRPLDNSKYGVDLVVKLAEKHPNLTFHIYGKGNFFKHHVKPSNVSHFETFLNPEDLATLLNHYRCAIMPTRLDAQGVMMCEIATYGMPIVTSDLPICKEMLEGFKNVYHFNNDELDIDLNEVLQSISLDSLPSITKEKFSMNNTIQKELEVFKKLKREQ